MSANAALFLVLNTKICFLRKAHFFYIFNFAMLLKKAELLQDFH